MSKPKRKAILCGLFGVLAIQTAAAVYGSTVRASSAGARLDSHLINGGGTDDTQALQRVLDGAKGGRAVHLIIDGPALVRGLNVYGHTTIECTAGGGLYLKGNSSRAILRNANRSRDAIRDEHITVRGCFLNGNRKNQPSADIPRPDVQLPPGMPSSKEADGTFITGLQFLGVNDLLVEDVTLWNVRAFAVLIGNVSRVTIRDIVIDHGGGLKADVFEYALTDGIHVKGPAQYINIDSIRARTGDDVVALNANDFGTDDLTVRNDFGPYVGNGPITDVTVRNVFLMDALQGFRILSSNQRVDRVAFSQIVGTFRSHFLEISHWVNPTHGNIGSVTIENVDVALDSAPSLPAGWRAPLMTVNAHIEKLSLKNALARVADDRPLLRIRPDTVLQSMDVELSTPGSPSGQVVQTEPGSRIGKLRFVLDR